MSRVRAMQSGSALVAAIAILTLVGLLAIGGMRTAVTETRLTASLADAETAFTLAAYGADAAFDRAAREPERLPTNDSDAVLDGGRISIPGRGSFAAEIRFARRDGHCPELDPLVAERSHYEIASTGTAGSAVNRQLRGFYICREICGDKPCVAAELPAVATYWTELPD